MTDKLVAVTIQLVLRVPEAEGDNDTTMRAATLLDAVGVLAHPLMDGWRFPGARNVTVPETWLEDE